MKYGSLVLAAILLCASAGFLYAEEKAGDATTMAPAVETAVPVEVGNAICPITGEKIKDLAKAGKMEHNGKIYNLCCQMCEKDFKKDPEAAIKKLEELSKEAPAADAHDHDHGKY